jgi:AcrR family transcriptional regulator
MRVLAERSVSGFTMEALAEAAGVNKAIPYRHFENAQAVLQELRRQINADVARRVLEATRACRDEGNRVRAAVGAYLDAVSENGQIAVELSAPGSPVATSATSPRAASDWTAELFVQQFGVPRNKAGALGGLAIGALTGAVEPLALNEATRATVEDVLVAAFTAAIRVAGGHG